MMNFVVSFDLGLKCGNPAADIQQLLLLLLLPFLGLLWLSVCHGLCPTDTDTASTPPQSGAAFTLAAVIHRTRRALPSPGMHTENSLISIDVARAFITWRNPKERLNHIFIDV